MDHNQSELDALQEQLRQLNTERKEALEGNMAFSFGYDPAVAAIEQQMQVVQTRINLRLKVQAQGGNAGIMREVVTYDEEVDDYYHFKVGDIPSSSDGNVFIVNRQAALGPILISCTIGQQTNFGMVVSINGSPLLSKQERDEITQTQYEKAEQKKIADAKAAEIEAQRIREAKLERARQEAIRQKDALDRQKLEQERRQQQHQNEEKQRLEAQQREREQLKKFDRDQQYAQLQPALSLTEARAYLQNLKSSQPTNKDNKVLFVQKAKLLRIRFEKSYSEASPKQSDEGGAGAIVGGLIGGFFGMLGGPVGAIVCAGIGAGIGSANGSSSKGSSAKEKWATLLTELNTLISSFS